MRIDLHGYTTHAAWQTFNNKVTDAYYRKQTTIIVITGQGAIMKEFPVWANQHPHVRDFTSTAYNPGSFKIFLKK